MTFDGLNLNPYSSVKSSAATTGMSNLPMLERKAKARLLANQYSNEQAIEAAKLGYQSQLDAFKPKETSWGDVAMGVLNLLLHLQMAVLCGTLLDGVVNKWHIQ